MNALQPLSELCLVLAFFALFDNSLNFGKSRKCQTWYFFLTVTQYHHKRFLRNIFPKAMAYCCIQTWKSFTILSHSSQWLIKHENFHTVSLINECFSLKNFLKSNLLCDVSFLSRVWAIHHNILCFWSLPLSLHSKKKNILVHPVYTIAFVCNTHGITYLFKYFVFLSRTLYNFK